MIVSYLEITEKQRTVFWLFDVGNLYDDSVTDLVTRAPTSEIHREEKYECCQCELSSRRHQGHLEECEASYLLISNFSSKLNH